ncbi:MAG: hypothetical protein ABFS14_07580 [Gemmatimonadota bacterium]
MTKTRTVTVAHLLAAAPLAAVLLTAGCDTPADQALASAELETRLQELVLQHASVQSQFRQLQAEALRTPGVREFQDSFYAMLRPKMIEVDPRAEEWLDRAAQAGHDMSRATGTAVVSSADEPVPPPDITEKRRIATEIQDMERALEPIRLEAMSDPAVAASFVALQDTLVATMLEIDPDSQVLFDQMTDIEAKIRQVRLEQDSARSGWVSEPAVRRPE